MITNPKCSCSWFIVTSWWWGFSPKDLSCNVGCKGGARAFLIQVLPMNRYVNDSCVQDKLGYDDDGDDDSRENLGWKDGMGCSLDHSGHSTHSRQTILIKHAISRDETYLNWNAWVHMLEYTTTTTTTTRKGRKVEEKIHFSWVMFVKSRFSCHRRALCKNLCPGGNRKIQTTIPSRPVNPRKRKKRVCLPTIFSGALAVAFSERILLFQ